MSDDLTTHPMYKPKFSMVIQLKGKQISLWINMAVGDWAKPLSLTGASSVMRVPFCHEAGTELGAALVAQELARVLGAELLVFSAKDIQ